MKEFIEKLTKKLYENVKSKGCPDEACWAHLNKNCDSCDSKEIKVQDVIRIVNQLAEEYNSGWIEKLLEAKKNCSEDSDCSECPFGQIEDRCILAELQIRGGNNGWIPCSERLPENNTVVLVTYITDDLEFIVYCVKYVDGEWEQPDYSEWSLDKDMVLAWQPLPSPYQSKGE